MSCGADAWYLLSRGRGSPRAFWISGQPAIVAGAAGESSRAWQVPMSGLAGQYLETDTILNRGRG
jgi:hypothetical protein